MLGECVPIDRKEVVGAKEGESVGAMGEVLLAVVLVDYVFEDGCLA